MAEPENADLRWWQYKRTWLIGIPSVVALVVAGLFAWGSLQPRPEGFAVAESGEASAIDSEAATGSETATAEELLAVGQEVLRHTLDATSGKEWVMFDFLQGRVVPVISTRWVGMWRSSAPSCSPILA